MQIFGAAIRAGRNGRLIGELLLSSAAVLLDTALFSRLAEDSSRTSWITSQPNTVLIALASAPAVPALMARRRSPAFTCVALSIFAALLTLLVGTRFLLVLVICIYTVSALTSLRIGLLCLIIALMAHIVAVTYEAFSFFADDSTGVVLVAVFYATCDILAWTVGQVAARARQREAHLQEVRDALATAARTRHEATERLAPHYAQRVFVNYRSSDTAHAAARLGEQLVRRLGSDRVFIDVISIGPGDDFRHSIVQAVDRTGVMLVLIGPHWNRAAGGRRPIAEPSDILRLEIEQALLIQVPVVPVLVDGASLPPSDDLPEGLRPLTRRNTFRLEARTFRRDAEELVAFVVDRLSGGTGG